MAVSAKEAAIKIIEQLPEDASFEDIMFELYVRQKVERGLGEADDGETVEPPVRRHPVRIGHVTVLQAECDVPPISADMVENLLTDMRREREGLV